MSMKGSQNKVRDKESRTERQTHNTFSIIPFFNLCCKNKRKHIVCR